MVASKKRSDVIDAYRALAILSVVLYHYLIRWRAPEAALDHYGFDYQYSPWFELGKFGVHVFFVISGYVIAMTISKSNSALDFAVRRASRLYPAYAVATLLISLAMVAGPSDMHVGVRDTLATMTMDAPLFGESYADGAFWSLLVEVKFYFWVAASFVFLRQRFWIGMLALAAVGTGLYHQHPHIAEWVLIANYMPLFLFGMAGWYAIAGRQHGASVLIAAVGLATYALNRHAVLGFLWHPPIASMAHAAILGGSASMLLLVRFGGAAELGPLAYVGRASYSWYLVHQRLGVTIIGVLCGRFNLPDAIGVALAIAATLGLGCVMYELIEKRCQASLLGIWRANTARRRAVPSSC